MILFFLIYGFREIKITFDYMIKGKTMVTSTRYEDRIAPKPNIKTIFKAIIWILLHKKYLLQKRNQIKSYRKISTKELENMNILCNEIL